MGFRKGIKVRANAGVVVQRLGCKGKGKVHRTYTRSPSHEPLSSTNGHSRLVKEGEGGGRGENVLIWYVDRQCVLIGSMCIQTKCIEKVAVS